MTETEFNAEMRAVLRAQGMRCVHVREADTPGPLDLVVWGLRSSRWERRPPLVWVELKIGEEDVRPSQQDFMWEEVSSGGMAVLVRLHNACAGDEEYIDILRPHNGIKGRYVSVGTHDNFRTVQWAKVFSKL